jgi:hypothetical protein
MASIPAPKSPNCKWAIRSSAAPCERAEGLSHVGLEPGETRHVPLTRTRRSFHALSRRDTSIHNQRRGRFCREPYNSQQISGFRPLQATQFRMVCPYNRYSRWSESHGPLNGDMEYGRLQQYARQTVQ